VECFMESFGKKRLLSPGKPWNLVFTSPGKSLWMSVRTLRSRKIYCDTCMSASNTRKRKKFGAKCVQKCSPHLADRFTRHLLISFIDILTWNQLQCIYTWHCYHSFLVTHVCNVCLQRQSEHCLLVMYVCWWTVQGRNHVFKVGWDPISWSRVLLPFYRKNRHVYPVCSRLHNHTVFIEKLSKKLGVRPNFGEVRTPFFPTPQWLDPWNLDVRFSFM